MISVTEARRRLVAIVESQVGTREQGGNNRGPSIERYQKATWLNPGPWPWCAAFACWCLQQWLQDGEVRALLGLHSGAVEDWRPQTAGAFDFEKWARKRGLQIVDEGACVQAGDIIIFDFSHIGFVTADATAIVKTLKTVEGNTNGKGDRDSEAGDGVWRKVRARQLAKCFIRIVA